MNLLETERLWTFLLATLILKKVPLSDFSKSQDLEQEFIDQLYPEYYY